MEGQQISLVCTENGSDKVYHAQLTPSPCGTGWLVTAQYGRRNGTLNSGDKITSPAPFDVALKAYNKLVTSKIAKGYRAVGGGSSIKPMAAVEKKDAGLRPQLLNAIEEQQLDGFLRDSSWYMQPKIDGERVMIDHEPGRAPIGINRRGLERPLPVEVSEAMQTLSFACVVDGELVGDAYYAFDLLASSGDLRAKPFRYRSLQLDAVLAALPSSAAAHFPRVPTFVTDADKRNALANLRAANAEGVVFHRASATYSEGRPASGGDAMKFKFCESASCVVSAINSGKRSVALSLFGADGATIGVGNVTVPPNHSVPSPGEVVEVRYLYAYPNGGSIFQPVYLGVRSDIPVAECLYSQLKFKASALAA